MHRGLCWVTGHSMCQFGIPACIDLAKHSSLLAVEWNLVFQICLAGSDQF